MENLVINISTVNGTGSLSANQLLTKIFFRSGWPAGSYNFFPSNIAGLPCLYSIRLNSKGHTGFSPKADILISLNPKTLLDDLNEMTSHGILISDEKDKVEFILNKKTLTNANKEPSQGNSVFKGKHLSLPISQSLKKIKDVNVKKRILFKNMIYVGFLCEWLKVENELVKKSIEDFFQSAKGSELAQQNMQAIQLGRNLALKYDFPFSLPEKTLLSNNEKSTSISQQKLAGQLQNHHSKKEILIDGNTSMALGALFAGCQFVSWYPITPASSLAENFEKFASAYQKDKEGKKKFMVVQSEDELAGITQAIGAGWAGLRAMTTTSGPGLSLMSEGAGLSYFAEVPVVLFNVQRAGPSTGLPTRTQQGDLLSSCFLSHGDSKHIVLLPGTPEEAFYWTAKAFELAEELQTLVIVLSDLDLGMNLKMSSVFKSDDKTLNRGKVLKEEDLEKINFLPFKDNERDGISGRTLPGIRHTKGAYLSRGSGHNERAEYSERHQDYSGKLDKLERKWQTAKTLMPQAVIESSKNSKTAFVTFGPNEQSLKELRDTLEGEGIYTNFMRVCSFPFPKNVEGFLKEQSEIFVVEQNRDGQLKKLLSGEFPQHSSKMKSLLQYDGRPLIASHIEKQFYKLYSKTKNKIFKHKGICS